MVVEIETGVFQPPRLAGGEHAERGAGLEPERLDAFDHGADRIEIAILRLAPRRAHAEAAGAAGFRRARFGEHRVERHQLFRAHAGIVARALRTVGAILRAAAGLDRQQRRNLHRAGFEIRPVHALRAEHQLRERQIEQRAHLGAGPVVADGSVASHGWSPLTPTLSPLGRGSSPRVLSLCHNHASPCSSGNCSLDRLKSKSCTGPGWNVALIHMTMQSRTLRGKQ